MQVYSRNMQHAELLAYHVGAEATDKLDNLIETDIFVIAVKDDAVESVASQLAKYQTLTVHTSGAVDLNTLLSSTNRAGVLYPLQTFSKEKELNFRTVPICIEGADEEITKTLVALAQTVSNSVQVINSAKRKVLHLAAVFACNFPNYLYQISQQILADNHLDFGLLKPLITETANKVQERLPSAVQTGPAVRNDDLTMAAHLQMLGNDAFLQSIYQLLSSGIAKTAKTEQRPE